MVIAALAAIAALTAGQAPCDDLLAGAHAASPPSSFSRSVRTEDLVRLRDFGPLGEGAGEQTLFALSPDRRSIALHLRRADPATNSYCLGLVVIDIVTGDARLVDEGGDLIRPTYAHNGLAGFPMGIPQVIVPQWSPDGRWLLLLKRLNGVTQAWRVRSDGTAREQLTNEPQDVIAANWSSDGRLLLFRTDPRRTEANLAIDAEGQDGWHYDDRFLPGATTRPFPGPSNPVVKRLDLATRQISDGDQQDEVRLDQSASTLRAELASPNGRLETVVTEKSDPTSVFSSRTLLWRSGAVQRRCHADACANAQAFWIEPSGSTVLILARSGWGGDSFSLVRWSVNSGRTETLSTTQDLLLGCQPFEGRLLCARETSTQPRRLVLLDPATGASQTLFNPNQDYDQLTSGTVERLHLVSDRGTRTFGDLMTPPGFAAGRHYPLVVVQYESRGFLRGGTGDEYPIAALASAGMIVLSFQRTRDVAATVNPPPKSNDDFNRIDLAQWADRRNVYSALMNGIEQVVARGWVDEAKIGITGLSDGIATAAFALLNSHRFAVAALSGCCEEPISVQVLQGPTFARMMSAAGYPPVSRPDPSLWAPYSLAQNAQRVTTPILIQAVDRELLYSLPTVTALRENKKPVDLYVYPGEYHVKWQPAHRLAVFDRTLRWFSFWFDLPATADRPSGPPGELERWQAMRAELHSAAAATGAHP